MAKEKFERTKPLCNLGLLGDENWGKNTLAAAICQTLTANGVNDVSSNIENTSEDFSHVEFTTANRQYSLANCAGYSEFVKNWVVGAAEMDGAILLVSATDGPMPKTRELVALAYQIGVPKLVVFLNKCDMVDDPELLDLVETDIRELLSSLGFNGEVSIIRGSALGALNGEKKWQDKIMELMDTCDNEIPISQKAADKPFLMAIEDIFTITGRGTVATGRVERGTLRVADQVECLGFGKKMEYCVTGVEMFRKLLDNASAGDSVGLLLRGAEKKDLARGMVLAAPGSIEMYSEFDAEFYLLTKEEGGRRTPIMDGYRPQFFVRTTDLTGTVKLPAGVDMIYPGSSATVHINLIDSLALEKGTRFAVREGGRTVGCGVVTKLGPASVQPSPAEPAKPEKLKPFRMIVEDVFVITGRGTCVTGRVEKGSDDAVEKIVRLGYDGTIFEVTPGVRKSLEGDLSTNMGGLLFRGVDKSNFTKGMILVDSGSAYVGNEFDADIKMPTKEEVGRRAPFMNNYSLPTSPQFCFGGNSVVGSIRIADGVEMVVPGDPLRVHVTLASSIAMEKGLAFTIRSGGRISGSGTIVRCGPVPSDPARFLMTINDVFTITGRGTCVTGHVDSGIIHLGDSVVQVGNTTKKYVITNLSVSNKEVDEAKAGDDVGCLLRGASKGDFASGMQLTTAD